MYENNIQNIILESIRRKRNILLDNSDWTQMPDSPLNAEKKAEWVAYRQQLRDITIGLDVSTITVWDDLVAKSFFPPTP